VFVIQRLPVLAAVAAAALVGGCSSGSSSSTPPPSHAPTSHTAPSPSASSGSGPSGGPTKVLTFVEENSSFTQMHDQMPYVDSLARQYAYATDFHAITHPSEPNYLAMAGGSTFGVTDDGPPSVNGAKVADASSVFDQAIARGLTAKLYAESMPSNCDTTPNGLYAVKHNPWAYFAAGSASCGQYDVPSGTPSSGALATDIASNALPNVGMVIPNLCNDAHNDGCSLAGADDWLKGWLPQILSSSDFTSGRLAVVITADEDDHSGGNQILTVVLSADGPHGSVVSSPLTHYSLSGLYSEVVGAPPLANAAKAPSMSKAFGL
jgi:phosphatidylinositol-3-phosphatase